jgi:hypothetical protein
LITSDAVNVLWQVPMQVSYFAPPDRVASAIGPMVVNANGSPGTG